MKSVASGGQELWVDSKLWGAMRVEDIRRKPVIQAIQIT